MALRALTGVNLRKVIGADDKTIFEGATVQVNRKSDGSLVTLYADKAGATTVLNPFTADNSGTFLVWVLPDTYEVTVTAGGSLGALTFDLSPRDLESIAHVNDFLPGAPSVAAAIEAACTNAETVIFGGSVLVFDSDVTITAAMACTRIDLQGATLKAIENAQLIVQQNNFVIEGGTYDGGLKLAVVSTPSAGWPSVLTVSDPSDFSVGDHITSSWTNRHLPNFGTLNTVANISGNDITLTKRIAPTPDFTETSNTTTRAYAEGDIIEQTTTSIFYIANTATVAGDLLSDTVKFRFSKATISASQFPSIMPQNARLFNARFDKSVIRFTGNGLYTVRNMVFQNCANAYYVDVEDPTETARLTIKDCKCNSIALDCFKFQCGTVVFDNVHCASPSDIGKQGIVWANNSKPGNLSIINGCYLRNGTRDTPFFVFPTGNTCYWPNTYIENSTVSGEPAFTDFIPNQIYNYSPALSMLSFLAPNIGAGQIAENVVLGDFAAVNSNFPGYQRALLGTTFSNFVTPGVTFKQGKINFLNCKIDGTPVDVRPGTGGTIDVGSVVIDNCEVGFAGGFVVTFMGGIREYNIRNSKLTDNFPETGGIVQTGRTTTQAIYANQFVHNTVTKKNYVCIAGGASGHTAAIGSSLGDTSKFLEIVCDVVNGVFENTIIEDRLDFDGNDIFWDKVKFNRIEPIAPDFTEASKTTTRNYSPGDTVINEITKDIYYCNVASFAPDDLTGSNFVLTNSNKPTIQNFQQGKLFGSAVLLGADATSTTEIDIKDWVFFNINPDNVSESDLPIIDFYVDNTGALIEYGGNEDNVSQIGLSGDYRFKYKGLRSDPSKGFTGPLNYRGAFMYNPPINSEVTFARDNTAKRIVSSGDVTIGTGPNGFSTITTTATSGTPNKGDWLSLNVDGTNIVKFHEITDVSGAAGAYNLTIRPNLTSAYNTSDATETSDTTTAGYFVGNIIQQTTSGVYYLCILQSVAGVLLTNTAYFTAFASSDFTNSKLIKSDWIYGAPQETIEVVRDSGVQLLALTWDTIEFVTERQNNITYASSDLSSGLITIPRGKYHFYASVAFKQASGNTNATMRTSIRLVAVNGGFVTFKSGSCTDRTDDTLASSNTLTTSNTLEGVFEISDEETVRLDCYTTTSSDIAASDADNFSAVLQITRIG